MKYFYEANALDRERPDTLAWLTICAVELGEVQRAKQGGAPREDLKERGMINWYMIDNIYIYTYVARYDMELA